MKALLLIPLVALGACTSTGVQPVKTVTQIVEVPVRMPCPTKEELARLERSKPTELSETPMPATQVERVARIVAQIGAYEADGGYNDQVNAILQRCSE